MEHHRNPTYLLSVRNVRGWTMLLEVGQHR